MRPTKSRSAERPSSAAATPSSIAPAAVLEAQEQPLGCDFDEVFLRVEGGRPSPRELADDVAEFAADGRVCLRVRDRPRRDGVLEAAQLQQLRRAIDAASFTTISNPCSEFFGIAGSVRSPGKSPDTFGWSHGCTKPSPSAQRMLRLVDRLLAERLASDLIDSRD